MPWARLDDRFHENRKVRKVWKRCPAAIGLHVLAITYSAGHMTDGFIDEEFVEDRMPASRERVRALSALTDAQLWLPDAYGWHINDFAEYNVTKADAESKHAAKAEAGKKGAAKRWGDSTCLPGAMQPLIAPGRDAVNREMAPTRPDPTRPDPTPPLPPSKGGRQRDHVRYEQELTAFIADRYPDVEPMAAKGYFKAAQSAGHDGLPDIDAYVRLHGAPPRPYSTRPDHGYVHAPDATGGDT